MQYDGPSRNVRVRIREDIPIKEWLSRYAGQECDATFYGPGMSAHINTEQIDPPITKWQSAKESDLIVLWEMSR